MSLTSRLAALLLLAPLAAAGGCDDLTTDPGQDGTDQESYPVVADRLGEQFGEQVTRFELRDLNVGEIYDQLEAGSVQLPVAGTENSVTEVELQARSVQLRAPGLEEGARRSGITTDPGVERVPLPPEQNYVLGTCEGGQASSCGGVTVLDDDRTMVGGVVLHPDVGTSFLQPVGVLLDDLPEGTPRGLHVLYHQDNTEPISFPEEEGLVDGGSADVQPDASRSVSASHDATGKETGVVLDGDVDFFEQDTATVWRRQELNMLIARLTFALIEPNSGSPHSWGLDLEIKGQEVWLAGGPDTTDGAALGEDVLEDSNYFTVHDVESDEMLVFYVGYEVGGRGYYGRAGGIPGAGSYNSSEFGGGTRNNRAWVKDMPRLSMNTVWGVSMHEVGHMLGGLHPDGCSSCSSGSNSGNSIMPAGKASLDSRDAFFSDDNDERIAEILNNVLP